MGALQPNSKAGLCRYINQLEKNVEELRAASLLRMTQVDDFRLENGKLKNRVKSLVSTARHLIEIIEDDE